MKDVARQSVLVTGASGFIGRRLVRRLMERGGRVWCLVRAESSIEGLRSAGALLVKGDVTDAGSVERALAESQAGAVFHLAGLVRAVRRDALARVNTGGVEVIAAACADRTNPPTLVIVSSLAAAGPCDGDRLRVEGDVPAPVSNYGRSKLAGELAAAGFAAAAPISIVRPPIVFGPGDQGVLEVFRPIARWGVHIVPGWSDHRLSLLYVDDLVDGLILVAEKGERLIRQGKPGQGVYLIAGDDSPTYAEIGGLIAKALGREPPLALRLAGPLLRLVGLGGDLISRVRGRAGWIGSDKVTEALAGSWTCSSGKIRGQVGWTTAATLAVRLKETAEWYRQAGWL